MSRFLGRSISKAGAPLEDEKQIYEDPNARLIELRKQLRKKKSWIAENDVLEVFEVQKKSPPRSLLERLPPEVLEIILLEVAREDKTLACWMCQTNRVFKLYIERAMYNHLALGSVSRDASLALMHTLRTRPPDFFSQTVHTLTIGLETKLHDATQALKVCSSVENLYLADNFPYNDFSRTGTAFPHYLQALFALHPKMLSIDIDNHLKPKIPIKASGVFWRGLVQLDLTVHSLRSSFLGTNLRAMMNLERMRVSLWPTAHVSSEDAAFVPFAEKLAGNLPPSLRYCVIFVASRGVLAKWVTSKYIAPVAEGMTDKRLILGTVIQDDEEKQLVETGPTEHRYALGQMCLMRWDLEKGVTIWELAEGAMRTRENAGML